MSGGAREDRPRRRGGVGRALRKQGGKALLGFINGLDWVTRDPSRLVDQTPHELVFQDELLSLRYYPPLEQEDLVLGTEVLPAPTGPRHDVPVLLIPPLMVKPFIYDLVPNRSYVRTLLAHGYSVYLVDFGEPKPGDEWVRLDDYILNWMPQAVDELCRHAGRDEVSLLGYCMGGLFALMHASANRDGRVRNIITIGSPVDAHKMGVLFGLTEFPSWSKSPTSRSTSSRGSWGISRGTSPAPPSR